MYSDLFDHLGSNAGSGSGNSGSSNSNEKQLVTLKAGKMDLTLQENGKYWAAPDTRRGEIRITWKNSENSLYWEWYDRREKSVADSDRHVLYSVSGSNSTDLGTMQRVTDVPNAAPQDRLYVWTRPKAGGSNPDYYMYWMQDASEEKDDEVIAQINQYLSDPASANPNAGSSSSGTGGGATSSSDRASSGNNNTNNQTSSSSNDRQQVDALSNILENLGMPQNESSSTRSGAAAAAAADRPTGTLTLADLQGAMAGVQSTTAGQPGPPLQEIVTPAAVASLMENEAVKNRLLELLPEEQRSEEFLEENLRSPQVQQTLRSLTAALLPDDTGSMDGYHSVLANFSMAEGAQEALQNNSNNPIQAFLECVLKSVEKEEGKEEESKE